MTRIGITPQTEESRSGYVDFITCNKTGLFIPDLTRYYDPIDFKPEPREQHEADNSNEEQLEVDLMEKSVFPTPLRVAVYLAAIVVILVHIEATRLLLHIIFALAGTLMSLFIFRLLNVISIERSKKGKINEILVLYGQAAVRGDEEEELRLHEELKQLNYFNQ